jgi:hypothetical protein
MPCAAPVTREACFAATSLASRYARDFGEKEDDFAESMRKLLRSDKAQRLSVMTKVRIFVLRARIFVLRARIIVLRGPDNRAKGTDNRAKGTSGYLIFRRARIVNSSRSSRTTGPSSTSCLLVATNTDSGAGSRGQQPKRH